MWFLKWWSQHGAQAEIFPDVLQNPKRSIKTLRESFIYIYINSDLDALSKYLISHDREIFRSHSGTVLLKVSKIVIFVCVLIKCCVCFDKMSVRCCKMCVVL